MGIFDTATKTLREGAGQAVRVGNWAAGQGAGRLRRITGGGAETPGEGTDRGHSVTPKALSDADLARKVESIIFRGSEVTGAKKGKIDINAVDGAVWLRGEAPNPAVINALEAATRAIPEVVDVHNLLHLPKTPAPSRTDTPAGQRKTAKRKPATPRTEPRRVNADKSAAKVDGAEQAPEKLAKQGKGRQPAKLGSKGSAATGTGTRATTATTATNGSATQRDRITRDKTEDSAPAKTPTSSVGTEGGPAGGGGEVV